jgi:sterol 24-C-methyltransferase
MTKSQKTTAETLTEYKDLFDESAGGDVAARKAQYTTVANNFYDLVTDFYQFGWCNSFHFAPRKRGESFIDSIARCERGMGDVLGLGPGLKAMDVGCGVGGPLCTVGKHSGANIIGVNNNDYQIGKANQLIERFGLAGRCKAVKADYMNLPPALSGFDAAYDFEATPHAPEKTGVFTQIFKALKPGAVFAGYEWCVTDEYDERNPDHRRLKRGIELGNGLPDLARFKDVIDGLKGAGFEVIETRDAAHDSDPGMPWYRALEGRDLTLSSIPRTPIGRALTTLALRPLETLHVVPRGTTQVSALLNQVADELIEAGQRGVFTPIFFFHARKPK